MMIGVRAVSGMVIAGCLLGLLTGSTDAQAAGGKVTLAAADFHPASNGTTYDNNGSRLIGTGAFLATVDLPPGATVTELRLFGVDADAADMSLQMISYSPRTLDEPTMASVASSGAKSRSRTFSTTSITNNPVGSGRRVYLSLFLPANMDLTVHGADVSYTLP